MCYFRTANHLPCLWEAVGVLAPCGDWERVAGEDKASYQRGICGPRGICTSFVVCQTVLWKQRSQSPELGASSRHEMKMNSQACNTFKKYLVWNAIRSLGIFCTVINSYRALMIDYSGCDQPLHVLEATGSTTSHNLGSVLLELLKGSLLSLGNCLWVFYHL